MTVTTTAAPAQVAAAQDVTDAERYAFDLNGYLVIEDAIAPELLEQLNAKADVLQAQAGVSNNGTQSRVEPLVTLHPDFLPLAMTPKVIARVREFVRFPILKSTWIDFKGKGGSIHYHSNHTPYTPIDAYHFEGGAIHCNLATVCYALQDVPEEGAALDVIPGSHKSNFPLPEDEKVLTSLRRKLPLKAGSAVIFSHDVNHGSYNSLDDYVRRCVFTSFSTGFSAYSQGEDIYTELFESSPEGSWQKYLLRRPQGNRDSYPQPEVGPLQEAAASAR